MLPNRTFVIGGLAFIFAAVLILITSIQGVTGYAISEDNVLPWGYAVTGWLFAAGIVLFAFIRKESHSKRK